MSQIDRREKRKTARVNTYTHTYAFNEIRFFCIQLRNEKTKRNMTREQRQVQD